jgi:TolA-binding protein
MTDVPDKLRDADERLRDLAKDIPWDRPTAARRDGIRSSLLVEAAESNVAPSPAPRRWLVVGSAFAAGVLAAAAVALLVVRRGGDRELAPITPAQITASPDARLDHQIVATETGVDEIVDVHDGKVRLALPAVRRGDHVRIRTKTAEVEGDAGEIEVVVVADALESVTVRTGSARVVVAGTSMFLSAGQTWRSSIITTDLSPTAPDRVAVRSPDTAVPPTDKPDVAVRSTDKPAPGKPGTAVRSTDKSNTAVRSTDKPDTAVRTTDQPNTAVRSTDKPDTKQHVPSKPRDQGKPAVVVAEPPTPQLPTKLEPVRKPDATKSTVGDAGRPDGKPNANAGTPNVNDGKPAVNETMKPTVVEPAKPDRAKQAAIERQFRKGWELLRAGKAREAAAELGAAADSMPQSPLAADARYWQAVALIRAGQTRDAERVLVQFLDNAPRSLRRGRAAVLLGRVLAERGDKKSAAAWYGSALSDPDSAIADAARAGLQALQK